MDMIMHEHNKKTMFRDVEPIVLENIKNFSFFIFGKLC